MNSNQVIVDLVTALLVEKFTYSTRREIGSDVDLIRLINRSRKSIDIASVNISDDLRYCSNHIYRRDIWVEGFSPNME